jgi:hypothetical protein
MNATGRMLLGIFASHGVLPLELKPTYLAGDLLLKHLDALEQEAEEKGGVQQVLADHFAKVYKVSLPLAAQPSLEENHGCANTPLHTTCY